MNKEVSWEKFKQQLLCSNSDLDEEELESMQTMYYCGWEDYEENINGSGLVVCDIDSLKTLSDNSELLHLFKKDTKEGLGTFVLLPTLSKSPLYSLSKEQLENNLGYYRKHYDDLQDLLKNIKGLS